MSALSAGLSLLARALPPTIPPLRLGDGCRFDSLTVSSESPVAISTISFASWFGSRGLLATKGVCHAAHGFSTALNLKLRHYQCVRCVDLLHLTSNSG